MNVFASIATSTHRIPRALKLLMLVLSFIVHIPVSDAAVDRYASLGNGEWTSEIDIIEEDPDYDETPADEYSCGARSQTHIHYFDTVDTSTYRYGMAIYAFAIVLEVDYDNDDNPATDDFLSNVDTENLQCTVGGSSAIDCGFDAEDDLGEIIAESSAYNGTTVTYQTLNFLPGNPKGLLWEYSVDNEGDLYEVPWLDGMSSASASPEEFNEYIEFGLVDYSEEFTATTTSYTLTAPMFVLQSADASNLNNWYHFYTEEADPDRDGDSDADPDGDYVYWYGMNAVLRSIFADCENACGDLDITSPTTLTAEDADTIITLTIDVDDEEGDTWDGTYEYTSDGTCEFTRYYAYAVVGLGSTTLETDAETVYAHSCTPGDTISIEEVDYPAACQDEISFEDACEDLYISAPSVITVEDLEGTVQIDLTTTAASGGAWNGEYTFAATASDGGSTTGEFYRTSTGSTLATNPYTTTSETVYYFNGQPGDVITVEEVDYSEACADSLTAEEAEVLYCADLVVSPTTITADEAEGIVTIDLTDVDQNDDDWDGTYTISSGGTCEFTTSLILAGLGFGSNPLTTTAETIYAHSCTPGESISIVESDYPAACSAVIPIETEEGLYCEELTLLTPQTVTAEESESVVTWTIDANDQNSDDWNGTYLWSSNNDSCLFTESETQAESGVGTTTLTTTATTVYSSGCDEGTTITVTDVDYATCTASLTTGTEDLYCVTLTVAPTTITAEEAEGVTPITLIDVDQNADDWAGTYTITSSGSCQFTTSLDEANLGTGTNPLTTSASTVYTFDCTPGDTISIVETTYTVCAAAIPIETESGAYCGDGVLDIDGADDIYGTGDDEQCDDGNNVNGDGCSSTCQTEVAEACISLSLSPETTTASGVTQVVYTITPDPATWPGPYTWTTNNPSGIFTADAGATTGNTITTSDLSVEYTGEAGDTVTVTEATGYGSVCYDSAGITGEGGGGSYCGDGTVDAGEQCDDGNEVDGDGCDADCTIPDGGGGGCVTNCGGGGGGGSNYCGDGTIQSPNSYGTYEECDDGNSENNDGCSNVCQVDEVIETPTYCGDGIVQTPNDDGEDEVCDDGNTDETDSCLSTCEPPPELEPEDELNKFVYTYNFGWFSVDNSAINGNGFYDTTYGHDYDYAFYTIAYTPDPNEVATEVTITDTIAEGIPGTIDEEGDALGTITYYTATSDDFEQVRCWVDGDTETFENCGNEGTYRGFSVKYEDGNEIEACDTEVGTADDGTILTVEDSGTTCYEGDISDAAGVTLKNLDQAATDADNEFLQIAIRYLGQVDNGDFDCNDTDAECPVLGFVNEAEVDGGRLSDAVDVTIICPYLLTRNAGDVYLEEDLEAGYDLSCYYDQNNSDGLVFRLVDSWQNSACTDTGSDDVVDRLSSYICEVLTDVETVSEWSVSAIKEIQEKQITTITRYNDNLSSLSTDDGTGTYSYTLSNFDDLSEDFGVFLSNEKQNVYKISGADLHIDLSGNTVPSGAYTFIVEEGDLYIDSDIEYDPTFDLANVTDLSQIPSIAFVVLGGDVYVSNSVSQMVGVYYVEAQNGIGGDLTGDWTDPFTPLEIYGSVYGNIEPLLEQRTFSGPANYDHGNVVIRYDERILLNTPPGLEEFVDIESERTVR